ncbi:MAG: hypothetical protein HRT61_19595 [Ekhidna sp.]|nr:hypothetical protein [Ekhidna sp.]
MCILRIINGTKPTKPTPIFPSEAIRTMSIHKELLTCGIKPTIDGKFSVLVAYEASVGDTVLAMDYGLPDSPYSYVDCEGVVVAVETDGSCLVEFEVYPSTSDTPVKAREWYFTVCKEYASCETMLEAAEKLISCRKNNSK